MLLLRRRRMVLTLSRRNALMRSRRGFGVSHACFVVVVDEESVRSAMGDIEVA